MTGGWTDDVRIDQWVDGPMDGWTDDGWMDQWVDGVCVHRMNPQVLLYVILILTK